MAQLVVTLYPQLGIPVGYQRDGVGRPRNGRAYTYIAGALGGEHAQARIDGRPLERSRLLNVAGEAWNAARGQPDAPVTNTLRYRCRHNYIPAAGTLMLAAAAANVAAALAMLGPDGERPIAVTSGREHVVDPDALLGMTLRGAGEVEAFWAEITIALRDGVCTPMSQYRLH
jgi:hypothetical protein